MRKWGAWGTGAVLLLGMGQALAGLPDEDSATGNATPPAKDSRWNGWTKPNPPEGAVPLHQGVEEPGGPGAREAVQGSNQVQGAAARRAREEARWTRRTEVCFKLQEIAERTHDATLRDKADLLEQRAWAVYLERTRNLPVGQQVFSPDRKILEKHVGSPAASGLEPRPGAAMYQVNSQEGP